jgi:hypothetical protein
LQRVFARAYISAVIGILAFSSGAAILSALALIILGAIIAAVFGFKGS